MNIIFMSIPISMILVGLAVAAFLWAVNSGQFDDLDSPAYSVLLDDDEPATKPSASDQSKNKEQ